MGIGIRIVFAAAVAAAVPEGLTAQRFVPNPFGKPGERMYRTGDIGCLSADGALRVIGRSDQELKISGLRVNLPDVERCLEEHPGVRRADV